MSDKRLKIIGLESTTSKLATNLDDGALTYRPGHTIYTITVEGPGFTAELETTDEKFFAELSGFAQQARNSKASKRTRATIPDPEPESKPALAVVPTPEPEDDKPEPKDPFS